MKNTDHGWNLLNTYSALPAPFYTLQAPEAVAAPRMIMVNQALAADLGLDSDYLKTPEGTAILAGNALPPGPLPLAQAYAGHQYGHFTMLGDGRAILLGEQLTPDGRRIDIQLKGSGRTPYSRGGDGRAALGPMLREYIISEAMHGLGIPTTRSLAVTATGEAVYRETPLPGAVLTRVASSHIRVGTFEYAAAFCPEHLLALADYTIQRHYPQAALAENPYLALLSGVIERQAALVANWLLMGFVHGVMNTDNMALSGETIDYGPCAFLDVYNPAAVFSSIDRNGRYAFANQPSIAVWNLTRLAEALLPLLDADEKKAITLAENALGEFAGVFEQNWLTGMRRKLGLTGVEEGDEALITGLLDIMQAQKADYTWAFVSLTLDDLYEQSLEEGPGFTQWKKDWRARLERQKESPDQPGELMKSANPAMIPRNHLVEAALKAAADHDDPSLFLELLKLTAEPFQYSAEQLKANRPPQQPPQPYVTYCGT